MAGLITYCAIKDTSRIVRYGSLTDGFNSYWWVIVTPKIFWAQLKEQHRSVSNTGHTSEISSVIFDEREHKWI